MHPVTAQVAYFGMTARGHAHTTAAKGVYSMKKLARDLTYPEAATIGVLGYTQKRIER